MSQLVFDGASPWSDLARIQKAKSLGAIALSIYIVGYPGGMRCANKADVDLIRSQGLGVYPNWERGAAYLVTCGRVGGIAAGQEAVAACRALGIPDDGTVAVAFSWDTDIDPSLYGQCGAVADGIITGLNGKYLFTAYGEGGLIDYLVTTKRMKPTVEGWLSMSEGFPGFNVHDPNIAMVQEHHADGTWFSSPIPNSTDVDTVLDAAHLHAWWPPNSPYGDDVSAADVWNFVVVNPKTGAAMKASDRLIEAETNAAQVADDTDLLKGQVASLQAALAGLKTDIAALKAAGGAPASYTLSGTMTPTAS